MKSKIKLFIAGIFISIFVGFICAEIEIYKENNTYYNQATILESHAVYNSDGNIEGYLSILDCKGDTYRFTDKDTYIKCIHNKSKFIKMEILTLRFSITGIFDDVIIAKVL